METQVKVCTYCKIPKTLDLFSPSKLGGFGVQARCKPCYAEIMRKRRADNPQAHRLSVKKHTQKNYDKKLSKNNEYRKNNPEKVKEWKAKYRAKHRPTVNFYNSKRRASLLNKTPKWANLQKIKDFYETAHALSMITGDWYHVDHIIPLNGKTVSGLHTELNLQILPKKQNLQKGNSYATK